MEKIMEKIYNKKNIFRKKLWKKFIIKKIFLVIFLFIISIDINAQDLPSGYTTNYGFRLWAESAYPSADSLNQNWKDIDNKLHQIDTAFVSKSRTINGQPLTSNINLTKANLGIDTTNFALSSRTINAKPLTNDIILDATDILNLDNNFLDPHDFELGQIIKVDTVGGDTVFVGDTISSSSIGGDGLTKMIYSIAVDHGHWLVTELFNNSGATLTSNNIYPNNGLGDWVFIYNSNSLLNKKLLFTPITVFYPQPDPGNDGTILGYIFSAGIISDNSIVIRTVGTGLEDNGDVIPADFSGKTDIILEFIIINS